jgi:hypothetical protein
LTGVHLELPPYLVVWDQQLEPENLGSRLVSGLLKVLVQTRQFHGSPDLAAAHDQGPCAAPAHEQALVDQEPDGLTDGGAGDPELLGEIYFSIQPLSRVQLA